MERSPPQSALRAPCAWRYDRISIALHWVVAATVLGQWLGAHAIDRFAPGSGRVAVRSIHIVFGAGVTALLGFRIWWRVLRGARAPSVTSAALEGLARVTHVALYLALIATLFLGLFNAWLRGDDIFGWFHLAKFGTYTPTIRHAIVHQVVAWHAFAANAILAIAGLHAASALVHHVILKDEILRRMLPWASRAGS